MPLEMRISQMTYDCECSHCLMPEKVWLEIWSADVVSSETIFKSEISSNE